MAWQTIVNTDIKNLKDVKPAVQELPIGTNGLIHIRAPLAGRLFDMAGTEQTIARFLAPPGATIIDAYGEGWNDGYIKFHGSPIAVVPFLYAIAAALAALGIVIGTIKFDADLPEQIATTAKWGSIGLIAIGAILIITSLR